MSIPRISKKNGAYYKCSATIPRLKLTLILHDLCIDFMNEASREQKANSLKNTRLRQFRAKQYMDGSNFVKINHYNTNPILITILQICISM